MDSLSPGSVGLVVCPDLTEIQNSPLGRDLVQQWLSQSFCVTMERDTQGMGLKTQQKNIQRVFSDVYWSVFSFYFS